MKKTLLSRMLFASVFAMVTAVNAYAAPATTSAPATKKTVTKKASSKKTKALKVSKHSVTTKVSKHKTASVSKKSTTKKKVVVMNDVASKKESIDEKMKHIEPLKLTMNMPVPATLTEPDPLKDFAMAKKLDLTAESERQRESELGQTLAYAALDHLGIRYRFGGTSPAGGFDCSGLIYYTVNKSLGVKLPRTARVMATIGEKVSREDLQPGDLVFFNTRGHRNSHVGIYLGDNQFIHAPRTGRNVSIESLNSSYWIKHYNGARRITKELAAR
ncbi:C40 family peptidase [Basilea psittacipulmonis]|uniref:C40 family peptidase n=1 Tax=Basilea psittacipulmonis TaxID=1472345 RepID=UPI00068ED95D|nr:C40 family peptidase [Basilea psittacipulmonis]